MSKHYPIGELNFNSGPSRLCGMEIIVNGETRVVADDYTAARLVSDMGLEGRRIAMEVNLEIVPRSTYADHLFRSGDRIEIVHAVGGG